MRWVAVIDGLVFGAIAVDVSEFSIFVDLEVRRVSYLSCAFIQEGRGVESKGNGRTWDVSMLSAFCFPCLSLRFYTGRKYFAYLLLTVAKPLELICNQLRRFLQLHACEVAGGPAVLAKQGEGSPNVFDETVVADRARCAGLLSLLCLFKMTETDAGLIGGEDLFRRQRLDPFLTCGIDFGTVLGGKLIVVLFAVSADTRSLGVAELTSLSSGVSALYFADASLAEVVAVAVALVPGLADAFAVSAKMTENAVEGFPLGSDEIRASTASCFWEAAAFFLAATAFDFSVGFRFGLGLDFAFALVFRLGFLAGFLAGFFLLFGFLAAVFLDLEVLDEAFAVEVLGLVALARPV